MCVFEINSRCVLIHYIHYSKYTTVLVHCDYIALMVGCLVSVKMYFCDPSYLVLRVRQMFFSHQWSEEEMLPTGHKNWRHDRIILTQGLVSVSTLNSTA